MKRNSAGQSCSACTAGRRSVLKAALGLGAALPFASRATAQGEEPEDLRPQPGDRFVYAYGDNEGEVIAPGDVPLGGPQILAYPQDPASGIVRDGSLLNQVLLVRLEPEKLSEATRANAADGIVGYSAICTHEACPVTAWDGDKNLLSCNCHGSQFDPSDAAEVVTGPATRRLAMLPLKVEGDALLVSGEFQGPVGARRVGGMRG